MCPVKTQFYLQIFHYQKALICLEDTLAFLYLQLRNWNDGKIRTCFALMPQSIVDSQIQGGINIYKHFTLKIVKCLPIRSLFREWFCLSEFPIVHA